ncbi:MAG: SGNH/GDSL hydrolase family protein [Chthoniobacteraceae bacterium]
MSSAHVENNASTLAAETQSTASALDGWRSALGKLSAGLANNIDILCVGDSNTAGYTSTYTNAEQTAYPTFLAKFLNASGITARQQSFWGTNTGGTEPGSNYDPRMSIGSGWSSAGFQTLGGYCWNNSTTTSPFAFTPTQAFDTVTLYFTKDSGSFTVDADGISTLYTYTGGSGTILNQATFSCPAGTHSVNIRRVSGSIFIFGMKTFDSSIPGVSVMNCGLGATSSDDLTNGTDANYKPTTVLSYLAPALVVINVGIKDCYTGVAASTYQTNLNNLVSTLKSSGASVIIASAGTFSDPSYSTYVSQFIPAMQAVAKNQNCLFINSTTRFGSYLNANTLGFVGSSLHLSAAGYADYAEEISAFIKRYTNATINAIATQNGIETFTNKTLSSPSFTNGFNSLTGNYRLAINSNLDGLIDTDSTGIRLGNTVANKATSCYLSYYRPNGSTTGFSITQDSVATMFMGFPASSNTFVFGTDSNSLSWRSNPTYTLGSGTEHMNLNLSTGSLIVQGNQGNLYLKGTGDSAALWLDRHSNSYTTGIGFTTNGSLDYFLHEGTDNVLRMGTTGNELAISAGNTSIDTLNVTHSMTLGSLMKLASYTVSALPNASTSGAGSVAFVSDATSTTTYSIVAGGGSSKVLVISDGSNWIIH